MQANVSLTGIIKKIVSTVISLKVLFETKMQIHFSDFFIGICIKICIWHFYIYAILLDATVFLHINFSSSVSSL